MMPDFIGFDPPAPRWGFAESRDGYQALWDVMERGIDQQKKRGKAVKWEYMFGSTETFSGWLDSLGTSPEDSQTFAV